MATKDALETIVAGNGEVYLAPVATPLPAIGSSPTAALNAAFVGTGYTSEDGVKFSYQPTVTDFKAWQSAQAIRRIVNTAELQAAFSLQQWNEETLPFAFGGGTITVAGGSWSYAFPASGAALQERSLIIDAQDGTRNTRIVIPRGNVTDNVETNFKRDELAVFPITFKALEPLNGGPICYILGDDVASFAPGS